MYDAVAPLDCRIDDVSVEHRERDTTSGFTRTTTVVVLGGEGETGRGEDVTYDADDHESLRANVDDLDLAGTHAFDGFSERVGERDLFFGTTPGQSVFRNYRRWAFESAALDLALKQAGTDLATRLGREYDPVRFVVSTRLGGPPTGDRVVEWLDRDPGLEFKLDPTSDWTPAVVDRLAATGAVRALDLKGQYHGTSVDQPPDPELYELVLSGFPDAVIEDPAVTDETRPLLAPHRDRLAWDYPITGVESVRNREWSPRWVNVKPSRFGSVESLFETLAYCERAGIETFGGGQFELDVGRQHVQALASLCYPDAPNDVAPAGYNDPEPRDDLPGSPLAPPTDPRGLAW